MATVATTAPTHTHTDTAPPPTKKKKTRSERKKAQREAAATEKLKIVVRRLPPNLPEEIFWQSVQTWVTDETAAWRKFYKGKLTKKYNKENIPSRAYIVFRSIEQVASFSQAYDGHVFRDKTGNESIAIVEFAPSQKVPPEKRKADNRMGTIDQDEEYLTFIESLNAPPPKLSEADTLETLIAASKPAEQPNSTPLLDALKAEKQAYNDRQTILKAHAHYREGDAGSKRRGKQTAVAVAPPAEATAIPTAGPGRRRRGKKGGGGGETKAPESAKPKEIAQPPSTKAPPSSRPAPIVPAQSASTPAPVASNSTATPESPRRPRIAGVGGAQRQFAAALSGAGLGGRRAASRKVAEDKIVVDHSSTPADAPKDIPITPQAPGSPGRNRGGRRRGDSVKSQAGGVPTIKEGQVTKSPLAGMLQLQPEAPKLSGAPTNEQTSIDPSGAPGQAHSTRGGLGEGKGGKRGRTRSRGKGRGGGEAGS